MKGFSEHNQKLSKTSRGALESGDCPEYGMYLVPEE